jgi:spermidine synthase
MDLWFRELQTEDLALGLRVRSVLRRERTPYQELAVLDTYEFGRMLVLDGAIQLTERDEFLYHEMLAHVPLFAHPHPRRVLIVGGGDGGTLREVLKHPEVEAVTLCDIDERVTAAARELLPTLAVGFDDPRVTVRHEDGVAFVAAHEAAFDVVLVDSTDPVGAGAGLYQAAFFASLRRALATPGIVCQQSESPLSLAEPFLMVQKGMRAAFGPKAVAVYLGFMPTYPNGLWTYSLAGQGVEDFAPRRPLRFPTRYYTEAIHRGALAVPPFVRELLDREGD